MDELIKKAFNVASYMATFSSQKQILKEEFNQNLLFFYNGGSFKITKELISFVSTIKDLNNSDVKVLLDDNNTPIEIKDITSFLNQILEKYNFAINEYYSRFTSLRSSRSIESILDK